MSEPDDVVLRANEVTQALHRLALETKDFINPETAPMVIEQLITGLGWLRHAIDHLALAHQRYGQPAHSDLTQADAEPSSVTAAARALWRSLDVLRHVRTQLELASRHSHDLAWPPPLRRWITVKHWEGVEAEDTLDTIDRVGPHLALHQLVSWDFGDETTDTALENGQLCDDPPDGPDDKTITYDRYALTYNRTTRQVLLLREHETPPDPVRPLRLSAGLRPGHDKPLSPYFTPPVGSDSRGMSL